MVDLIGFRKKQIIPTKGSVILPFICLVVNSLFANTYTPTTTTDFPISGGGISVNNANGLITGGAGNGQVTLRSAIAATNNIAGPHTINLSAGTYNLTISGSGEMTGGDITKGDLDVLNSGVTIQGVGMNLTIINQTTGIDRVFDVDVNYVMGVAFNFTIDGVTVSGGRASTAVGNTGEGGGIFCGSNTANGLTTITNCKFLNNQTVGAGFGGGAVDNVGGNMVITGCIFGGTNPTDFNQSGTSGGAVYWDGRGMPQTFMCSNCTFTNNVALSSAAGGGGIDVAAVNLGSGIVTVTNCTFTGNTANFQGGGAITNESITLNVTKCNFLNNTGKFGGAIKTGGGPGTNINFCRFIGNMSVNGGAGNVFNAAGVGTTLNGDNNWWGVNTGPAASDYATDGFGVITINNWLKMTHTPGLTPICANTSTSLTASFLVNSAGTSIPVSNLTVVIGLPILFNNPQPAGSTISSAQTTIQANGMATATFNAGSTGGSGGANAVVDNATVNAAIFVQTPPVVTLHPLSQSKCDPSSVTFTSTASGNPTPTVQWQVSTNGGMSFTNIAGATSTTLTFTAVFADNGKQYRAVFTNICNVTNSNAATLTVFPIEHPEFAYAKSAYCTLGTEDPLPIIYGTPGGIFSATPPGLSINMTTGQLDVSASTVGIQYTITYNTNGPCPKTATFQLTIVSCLPTATLVDAITIDNGTPGVADPNDRIRLTATIGNAQTADYNSVQLVLNNDPKVTLVAGSFKSTPVAVNDLYQTTLNTILTVPLGTGVIQNDFDDNIPGLSVTAHTNPTHGTVAINANGSFTYTPTNGFSGDDSFTYTITDSDAQTNIGTVKIHVQ